MPQLNRERRGHDFFELREGIPAHYETEEVNTPDKQVMEHFFCSYLDWYLMELDTETSEGFGYVWNRGTDEGEWGYFSLLEMESLVIAPYSSVIERDLHFTPKRFSEISF